MAKTTVLLLLLISSILVVADQAAAAPATKLSPAAQKSIDDIALGLQKAIAAPPAKQKETLVAVLKSLKPFTLALDKAKETGDEKKIARLALTVEVTTASVNAAPADKKLEALISLATPNPRDCPAVDKAYCEMHSKVKAALDGVVAAGPGADKTTQQAKAAVVTEAMRTAASTVNKVYAGGDEKKIAQVIAAYTKAADEVIAAAPADKLKVMEKTYAAAKAVGN